MSTIDISIPEPLKEFLEAQAAKEGFASIGDYLRDVIEGIQIQQIRKELAAKLLEAANSPTVEISDQDWADMEKTIRDKFPGVDQE